VSELVEFGDDSLRDDKTGVELDLSHYIPQMVGIPGRLEPYLRPNNERTHFRLQSDASVLSSMVT
jgi:hypothetical protein